MTILGGPIGASPIGSYPIAGTTVTVPDGSAIGYGGGLATVSGVSAVPPATSVGTITCAATVAGVGSTGAAIKRLVIVPQERRLVIMPPVQ